MTPRFLFLPCFAVLLSTSPLAAGGLQPQKARGHVTGVFPELGLLTIHCEGALFRSFTAQPAKDTTKLLGPDKELTIKDFRLRDTVEVTFTFDGVRTKLQEVRFLERDEKLSKRAEELEKLRKSLFAFGSTKPTAAERAQVEKAMDQTLAFVGENPKDAVAADALVTLVKDLPARARFLADSEVYIELRTKAGLLLIEHHPGPAGVYANSLRLYAGEPPGFLEALLESKASPAIRADACEILARRAYSKGYPEGDKESTALALKHFERLAKDFGAERRGKKTMAEEAEHALYSLRHVWVGKPAPEIDAADLAGMKRKLSDFRGKVVVLHFWRGGGIPGVGFSLEQKFLEKHGKKVFAALGVSLDPQQETAKEMVARNRITWPTWWDGTDGPIGKAWQAENFPRLFVIDAKGIIRLKGGANVKRVHEVVEELVREAGK